MRHSRRYGVLFGLAFFSAAASALSQPIGQDDNLAVFQKLFDKAAGQVVAQLSTGRPDVVVVVPVDDPASALWMLRMRTMKRAMENGHRVFDADSLSGTGGYVRVSFPRVDCTVDYANVRSGFLWRSGSLRRRLTVELGAEVTEQPSARVLITDVFRADFADTVRSSEITRLEESQSAFTRGRMPPQSFGARVFEPLLLTISTGAAIYALYALRSR
jgi:hypothetical protein